MSLLRRGSITAPVRLGEVYRDSITGFEGVATWRAEYLHGCVRVGLEAGKDGRPGRTAGRLRRLTHEDRVAKAARNARRGRTPR